MRVRVRGTGIQLYASQVLTWVLFVISGFRLDRPQVAVRCSIQLSALQLFTYTLLCKRHCWQAWVLFKEWVLAMHPTYFTIVSVHLLWITVRLLHACDVSSVLHVWYHTSIEFDSVTGRPHVSITGVQHWLIPLLLLCLSQYLQSWAAWFTGAMKPRKLVLNARMYPRYLRWRQLAEVMARDPSPKPWPTHWWYIEPRNLEPWRLHQDRARQEEKEGLETQRVEHKASSDKTA